MRSFMIKNHTDEYIPSIDLTAFISDLLEPSRINLNAGEEHEVFYEDDDARVIQRFVAYCKLRGWSENGQTVSIGL